MIYFLYRLINSLKFDKCGATMSWDKRCRDNRVTHGDQCIITVLETMEGPNTPEMWQVVGDREWELADQYGYPRGEHYRMAREKRPSHKHGRPPSKQAHIAGGKSTGRKHVESGHLARVRDPHKAMLAALRRIVCEHCGTDANTGNYKRWHGDNCKHKKTLTN